jgi:hypothetical protein
MKKVLFFLAFSLFICASMVSAQPRPVANATVTNPTPTPAAVVKPAPQSFTAKYEGGMFGYGKKETGMLKIDDLNERIVFYGKDRKEMFAVPFKSMLVVSAQTRSVRSAAGTAVSVIPLPGAGLAGLIKEKRRYLAINFDDPDVDVQGVVNFKLANKELLESVIQTLGEKAKMTKRGETFYRPKPTPKSEI